MKPYLERGVFRELRNVHYFNDRVGSQTKLTLRH